MKVGEILNFLDEISPFELQESWDNSGLIVGSRDCEIEKIYLTLDIDENVICSVECGNLVISHHPLIFKGLKRVTGEDYSSKFLTYLIKKDVPLISMHTNFDKTHMSRYFGKNILGFDGESEGFVYYVQNNMDFYELVSHVKNKLQQLHLRVVDANKPIEKIAVITGSGMGMLDMVDADCIITGDVKYHDAMEAKARGISVIDVGHYESERYFVDALYNDIKDLDVEIIKINSLNPFNLI
ncbi:MAG: Nif3-like dinuclear metal center hexameric protein [Epsilonproteobacteria bacterium]|nr:Nif3-like dinuclear metal center hexameric protein [Campylobacterota bacterium]